ncbi:unnamed protein product [Diabrotica balteata]|uniref:RRM domain-containing protein n=1 Tax=Diabrotica balteata TaxID=107213 RepID=A0A9N9TET7_DIABA|nr:unnamed protein product [Diabrotica balteata]
MMNTHRQSQRKVEKSARSGQRRSAGVPAEDGEVPAEDEEVPVEVTGVPAEDVEVRVEVAEVLAVVVEVPVGLKEVGLKRDGDRKSAGERVRSRKEDVPEIESVNPRPRIEKVDRGTGVVNLKTEEVDLGINVADLEIERSANGAKEVAVKKGNQAQNDVHLHLHHSVINILIVYCKPPFLKRPRSPLGIRGTSPLEELSAEERDARTVFIMQLSQRIRARDLEDFFSSVGKVRDVRMIVCNKTRRFKGIAYIEFKDPESVALALGLSGQKLLGIPIIVQHTQAEKNRMGNSMPNMLPKGMTGPMRLYVGSLHFNITEEMLRGILNRLAKSTVFSWYRILKLEDPKDMGSLRCDDAKKALEQLNGFELAGRPMKVGNVTERLDLQQQGPSILDSDELDRSGIDLGATGRLQLMFKLAEGAGMQVPQAAANALSMATGQPVIPQVQTNSTPPIATQCFMLSNMFDPSTESNPSWDVEVRDDVIEECNKHGGVLHVYVDKGSPQGNVYVKCPSIATAVASVNTLHGRWFAGRVITAAYVPLLNYHSLFPDAMTTTTLLLPSSRK